MRSFKPIQLMPPIVDAHQDLAWNILSFGRDYSRSAEHTRQLEKNTDIIAHNGDTLLGWPDYQHGQVSLIFSTLFSTPARFAFAWETMFYRDFNQARRQYRQQVDVYYRMADEHPDKFQLISSASNLDDLLASQQKAMSDGQSYPVGLFMLMEGAEGILEPTELEEWWELGLRTIGPAWAGTRYCGGTKEPGPLTNDGRKLLSAMADLGFTLDISHMDEESALQALDYYEGRIIATHANCLALLPGFTTNRQLSDRIIHGLLERDGVIGVVPFNSFLKSDWLLTAGSRREEVTLEHVVAHIDHICQIAGDAHHVGLGTDFDGGFGLQSVPAEIDTIVDLQKLAPLLTERGYTEDDVVAILGNNWLDHLRRSLP